MDTPLFCNKPHRLKTSGIPSAIALNPSGDHLAVGCSNGDICIWRLPLEDDALLPTHKVCINEWSGVGVLSALWVSDTLVAFGRRNGLIAVIKLDYVRAHVRRPLFPLPTILQSQENLSVVNLEADDPSQAIRHISYHDRLKRVATAASNDISIWDWDQRQCMSWQSSFRALADLVLGHLWKKVRTFPAHTAPALSKEEESVVEITSVHWLKRHKGLKGALLVSFLHHGVRSAISPSPLQPLR
jgi:WD40 repeat protein